MGFTLIKTLKLICPVGVDQYRTLLDSVCSKSIRRRFNVAKLAWTFDFTIECLFKNEG